jgi:prevent-host-death family protein
MESGQIRWLTFEDARKRWEELLDQVEEGDELVIMREGKAVARLIPPRPGQWLKGRHAGIAHRLVSDEELIAPIDVEWTFDLNNIDWP